MTLIISILQARSFIQTELTTEKERLDQTIVNIWGIFNELKFQIRKWHYSDSIYRI